MEINEIQRGTKSVAVSLIVKFQHIMSTFNNVLVQNNIENGGEGLSQIFCGRLSENLEKTCRGSGNLLLEDFIVIAYVNQQTVQ